MPDSKVVIPLTRGYKSVVDKIDSNLLSKYRWAVSVRNGKNYAKSCVDGKRVYMHRFLLGLEFGNRLQVDHIDNDGLNNTRENLRTCTRSQNYMNRIKSVGKTSKYKGVYFWKLRDKWGCKIKKDGETFHIGYFLSERDAAIAYNVMAIEKFGKFARLNAV